LASVADQRRAADEVIVVDDGSTDNGAAAVDSFPGVHLLRQENAGVSAARNAGVAAATHPVVAFLDADDTWQPHFLAVIAQLCDDFPGADLYGTGYVCKCPDGTLTAPVLRGVSAGWRGVLPDYFAVAARSSPPYIPSTVAVRKAALGAIGGFPLGVRAGEDLLTWARLAAAGELALDWQPAVVYTKTDADGAVARVPAADDVVGHALAELADEMSPAERPAARQYVAMWHRMRADCFLRLGRKRDCLDELRQCQRYRPLQPLYLLYLLLLLLPGDGELSGRSAIAALRRLRR
jgi:glycosyltransferase involved in cell wall biosynthesis